MVFCSSPSSCKKNNHFSRCLFVVLYLLCSHLPYLASLTTENEVPVSNAPNNFCQAPPPIQHFFDLHNQCPISHLDSRHPQHEQLPASRKKIAPHEYDWSPYMQGCQIRSNNTVLSPGSFRPIDTENDLIRPSAPMSKRTTASTSADVIRSRRIQVMRAVVHAWDSYVDKAWGFDELLPLTAHGKDVLCGVAVTIVDSLDTLYLMGLTSRYEKARDWVLNDLDFSNVKSMTCNFFEVVIRLVGGLLSAFYLSGDQRFITKADDLAIRFYPAFNTPHGFPLPKCNISSAQCEFHGGYMFGSSAILAEVGTLQLELRALAHHSCHPLIPRMRDKAEQVVFSLNQIPHLRAGQPFAIFPTRINILSAEFSTNYITLGGAADSYYEYLLKSWIQGGKHDRDAHYWDWFKKVIHDIMAHMVTTAAGYTIVRDLVGDSSSIERMDHFTCFLPGVIVLALGDVPENLRASWLDLAAKLTETCYQMYAMTPSGLSGEYIRLHKNRLSVHGGYELRPEAIEAFFYMYRYTHDEKYRRWAWEIFEKIEQYCKTTYGYAALKEARARKTTNIDTMHSFLISETFKYIYLLFTDDDFLSLDKYVFNTEAHPLLIFSKLDESYNMNEADKETDKELGSGP